MTIRSYRDLRVWQEAMSLVDEVYRFSHSFPQHELYGLTARLHRAAVSIPSNIAEAHAREATRAYIQQISVAQGSLGDGNAVRPGSRLRYLPSEHLDLLLDRTAMPGRQLFALRNALLRKL